MSTSREYFLLIVESFGRIDIPLELTIKISNYDIFFEIELHVGLKLTLLTISSYTTCSHLNLNFQVFSNKYTSQLTDKQIHNFGCKKWCPFLEIISNVFSKFHSTIIPANILCLNTRFDQIKDGRFQFCSNLNAFRIIVFVS